VGISARVLLILAGAFVAITRWWRLLAVAGCGTRWTIAFRLSFLGLFFNVVLPAGITGGDVIKAVLVVREHPERRADAFVTVVVDRALGLLVLMALASIVVLVSGDRFAELKLPVVGAFLAALVGIWFLLHRGRGGPRALQDPRAHAAAGAPAEHRARAAVLLRAPARDPDRHPPAG
jgi:hypothetical protein